MNSILYKYIGNEPYSRKSQYSYMTDHSLLVELTFGTVFAVVPDNSMFTLYKINGSRADFLFNCNKRDLETILTRSKKQQSTTMHVDLIRRLKFHIFNIIDNLEERARLAFFKSPNVVSFNKTLFRTKNPIVGLVSNISNGKLAKFYRDKITIASEIFTIDQFKALIMKVKDDLRKKLKLVEEYLSLNREYNEVFRSVSLSEEPDEDFVHCKSSIGKCDTLMAFV